VSARVVEALQPQHTVYLDLDDERLVGPGARSFRRGSTVAVRLLPVRRGAWLSDPGWVVLPLNFGPGMRPMVEKMGAIDIECWLQGSRGDNEAAPSRFAQMI
jgi:hypothetical protein